VIAEPVLGEGGFVVPPRDYFRLIQEIAADSEFFHADECNPASAARGSGLPQAFWDRARFDYDSQVARGGLPLPPSPAAQKSWTLGCWQPEGTFTGNPLPVPLRLLLWKQLKRGPASALTFNRQAFRRARTRVAEKCHRR